MQHLYRSCRISIILLCLLLISAVSYGQQCPQTAACVPASAPAGNASLGMGIYRVELNTLNNRTAGATDGYKDYACTLSTQLTPGLPYSITVETGVAAENVRVWIDYNNDGSFHPTGELFFSSDNQRVHTGATQLIPATAVQGKALRMRVAADYTNSPMPGPCTTPQYSQTEDYAVVLGANTQPPLADFTVETAQACAGSFRFVDRSQRGATAWEWDFGDGTRSTQQSPVHTYTTPGRYAVTLQACNANGCDSANDTTSAVFYARAPVSASCAPRTTAYCCGYGLTEVGIGDLLQRSADASAGYEDFSCTRRVTVTQTDAIPLLLRGGQNTAQSYWLYVDSNEDGQFSAAELVWQTAGSPRVETFFVLPEGVPVNRPLRLRVIADAAGSSPDACADRLNGQVEDYSLVVTPVTCPAPVRAGQLNRITLFTASNSSKRSVLMISNHSPGARIQWQTRESTTSNSTWKNEAGATLPVFSTVLPGGYYRRVRAVVSCGASSVVTKEVEMADITRFNYLHTTCGTTYISRVALAGTGLLAVSACEDGEGPGFSLRDPANPRYTATLRQGETYALQVTTSRSCRVSVFAAAVDGGDVRVGNRQILRVTAGVPTTVLVPIDSSWATSGTVLLRIRCDENALIPDIAVDEETVLGAGETEDYLVGVRPWQCAEPTQAGRITAPALVCGNTSTDLSVFGYSLGSRLQWQSSLDSVTWQDIAGAQSRELRQVVQQTTYFRVRVRGCSSSMYSPVARVTVRPHTACYCTGPTGTATTTGLTRVRMIGTSLDNASSGTGPALVAYAPNVPSRTATLIRGASYALDITISSGQAAAQPATLGAWLDADHSGTYDLLEWVQLLHLPSLQAGAATYRVLLPIASGAQLGETGLRLRISPDPLGYGDACAGSGGEVEEYLVQIAPAPCPAALTAGSVVAGSVLSCATVLRSESYSIGAALQWQVSRTQGSSWEDVPGATAAAFSLPFVDRPTAEYYRLQARCEGQVASSAAVIVPAGNCQTSCLSAEAGSSVSTQVYKLYVDDVILVGTTLANYGSGLNESRSSYGWKTTHIRWPVQVPNWTATVQRGGSYPLQLTLKGNGPMNTGVWADWNHDGQFSTGEYYGTAATSYGPVANLSFTLSVPATAALGSTVLRLRVCNVALEAQHGCASLGLQSSETEDYVLTVTDQPGPVLPTVVATPAVLCLNAPVRLEATNSGAGAVYSWLGPNGFRATGSSVTLPAATAASAGTYVVSAEQNGQRIVTSVYLPVASCLPTATQPSLLAAGLTIFPNPTTGYCTLQLPAELHSGVALQVRIRTPAGQLARELTGSATRSAQATGWELPLDLRLLPRGLYFVELLSPRGSVFGKILVE